VGFLLHLLFEELFGFLAEFFWWLIPNEIERRNDRKRCLDGEVRCALRAVRERVLNIDTEWSVGIATVSPGMVSLTT